MSAAIVTIALGAIIFGVSAWLCDTLAGGGWY